MRFITISGNGVFPLAINGLRPIASESTVYIPASIGGAALALGWIDNAEVFNPYEDGTLIAGQSTRVLSGTGVRVVLSVSGFTTTFDAGIAE